MENITKNFCKENCCGCMSCVNSCPTGALFAGKDEYGFTIPKLNKEKCINCGKCLISCPYHSEVSNKYPIRTYAVVNRKGNVIEKSSSGGVFSALAKKVIEENGYVIGATMDNNFQVKHICIDNMDDLYKLQKSKYIQSNTNDIYKIVKEKLSLGKKIIFSGTPCQIAGLKAFLNNKDWDNLICIDIVCHGVPSQDLFDDYINCLSNKIGKIDEYEFRTKKKAKNGMNWYFSYKINGKNKKIIKNWPEDSYNYLYMKKLIYRDSCYACKFAKKKRTSDITLCDYWGWDNYHDKDFDKLTSLSGCIINSSKGQKLFDLAKEELKYVESNYDDLSRHNKSLNEQDKMNEERNIVLNLWKSKGYTYIDNEFKKKMKKQIVKYRFMRLIPESIKNKLVKMSRRK